jgi:hypothetical protein
MSAAATSASALSNRLRRRTRFLDKVPPFSLAASRAGKAGAQAKDHLFAGAVSFANHMRTVKLRWVFAAALGAAVVSSAAIAATMRSSESTGSSGSTAKPALSVAPGSPLGVAGRGFKAGERVTVTATLSARRLRKAVVANRRGRFTARFSASAVECGPLYLAAVGAKGSRAAVRVRGVPPPCGIDPSPAPGPPEP